jgi:hypothetical protein
MVKIHFSNSLFLPIFRYDYQNMHGRQIKTTDLTPTNTAGQLIATNNAPQTNQTLTYRGFTFMNRDQRKCADFFSVQIIYFSTISLKLLQ